MWKHIGIYMHRALRTLLIQKMIGATAEVQQDPEKAGQAMKILSLRLRGMKGELEELGEEADGVENISKMQGQILNMTKGKVNIFGDSGEFRSTYDIMKDIASIYDELSSTDQANLLETIAGKNRANDVAALIENFDTAIQMAETAENSAGSAARENAKYVDSLQGKLDIMKASIQAFSNTALESDFLKGGVDAVTGIINVFTKLVDIFGGFPTVMGAVAAAFSLFNKGIVTVGKSADGVTKQIKIFGQSVGEIKGIFGELWNTKSLTKALTFDGEDVFAGFKDRLDKDKQDLSNYIERLSIGDVGGASNIFAESSSFVQEYISSTDEATRSVERFSQTQKEHFVQLQASNKGFKSSSNIINEYNAGCKKVGMTQQVFASTIQKTNPAMGKYLSGLNGAKASMTGYIASAVGGKLATIAFEASVLALNAALTMGIGLLIQGAITAIDNWIHKGEKLAESVDAATSSYKQQHEELSKGKATFDEAAKSYEKLHKGVSKLNGENISLTPDEYDEYINAANTIADMVPSLVAGYDEQGNAILNCAGDVDTLTDAYNKLIVAENNKLLNGDGEDYKGISDISDDLSNFYDDSKMEAQKWADGLEKVFESNDLSADSIISNVGVGTKQAALSVVKAMEDANKTIEGVSAPNDWTNQKDSAKYLAEVYKQYPEVIRSVIGDVSAEMDSAVEEMRAAISAHMENAFINEDYKNLDEDMQSIASSIVGGIDSGVIAELNESGGEDAVISYVDNILSALDTMGLDAQKKLKSAFDLESSFKNGNINFGEYKKQIDEIESTIDSLDVDTKIKDQLKESLDIDGVQDEYHSLIARLEELGVEGAASFAEGLSSTELSAAYDVIADIGDVKIDGNELKKKIEDAAKLQEAMNFTIDIQGETEGIEAFNTALSESRSATGLTVESMDALKNRYESLPFYDAATLFEETANGISLNAEAVNEYEQELADSQIGKNGEVTKNLDTLKNKYDELTNDIANCTDAAEKSKLINEREDVRKHITDIAELATAYEGLTSSYAEWQRSESSGNDRDLYSNVHSAMEGIGKELENGWIDDGTKEYFQLIWGEDKWDGAGKSIQDYRAQWDTLDDTIQGTSYSIQDFFKTNKDGELTSEGIFNFFDAVDQVEDKIGRDVIKKDDNGNIVSFDFGVDGDKAIADALGISEELVQIFLRASRDAGFVVNFDGTYTQLANLQNEAMAAQDSFNALFDDDKEYSFNFNTQSLKEAQADLKEAEELLNDDKFWNHDANGKKTTFNYDAKGAKEAMQMVSTLQAMVDNLDNSYIGITVEDKQFEEPLEKAQDYEAKVAELNQLKLDPEVNASDIESLEEDISGIIDYFAQLDDETKKELKIPVDLEGEELDNKIKEMLDNGTLEIPTTLDIQTNMNESIEDLRDLALLNSGLLSEDQAAEIEAKFKVKLENEDIEKQVNEVLENVGIKDKKEIEIGTKFFADTQDIDEYEKPEEIKRVVKFVKDIDDIENYTPEDKQAIAKFVKDVKDIENYTPEQKQAIVEFIRNATDIEKYTPEQKQAIVNYAVNGGEADSYQPKDRSAIVNFFANSADPDNYTPEQKQAFVEFIKQSAEVDGWTPEHKDALVKFGVEKSQVDAWAAKSKDETATVTYTPDTSALPTWFAPIKRTVNYVASGVTNAISSIFGGGSVDGTAHVNGTAYANGSTGRAFKKGSWDTKDSGTALMGELGQETIVRDGRFFTVGDNGAEFVKYRKGDIIFNHKQTEELFKNGYVTSGGGRGRAYVEGTAFSRGTGAANPWKPNNSNHSSSHSSSSSSKKKSSSKSSSSSSSNEAKEDFEETIDWIEKLIDRMDRALDRLDRRANNVHVNWRSRNKALANEINKTWEKFDAYNAAYNRYMQEANSVGLSGDWAQKVRDGVIDISTITDENLKKQIDEYSEWYEKALDVSDAIDEIKEHLSELNVLKFDQITEEYDKILENISFEQRYLEEMMNQDENRGYLISSKYYDGLIENGKKQQQSLQEEKDKLLAQLEENVRNGAVEKYSDEWYREVNAIDDITISIEEMNTQILEWQKLMREVDWGIFDLIQERISNVTKEADFLIELMSNKKLYQDNGQLTDEGKATMGLHGQNYNSYMYQADKYAQEIKKLDAEIAKDPYNQDLINRRQELLELQQESILNAEQEKDAIKDMVEEGINKELDALQELIDKRNEALDAAKDLYDYQKKVQEQTENIASLEKQLSSLQGDDSEEAKKKLQQLKVELSEAREDLEETEYEKYISDQKKLMDDLYLEYETILNARLDNIDALITDMIAEINANSGMIGQTIDEAASNVGYTLSDTMRTVWDSSTASINGVITMYGDKFMSAQTTLNAALNNINANVMSMVNALNQKAQDKVEQAGNSSASKPNNNNNNSKPTTPSTPQQPTKPKADAYGIAGSIWVLGGSQSGWGNNPTRSSKLKNAYGADFANQVQSIINSTFATGKWDRKRDYSAYTSFKLLGYKDGKRKLGNDEYAWTQENGAEMIVRPSDGAILTPLAKNDSVLTSSASSNIWNMANNPSEFIKDNLGIDADHVPNGSGVSTNITQTIENVTFSMPNVKNYDQMLRAMQKDKNFERLVNSMGVDRLAGGSKLAKGKAIK